MKLKIEIYIILSLTTAMLISCKKYLDVKPATNYSTVSTLADVQGLLENFVAINGLAPYMGEWSSDNYYLPDATFAYAVGAGMDDIYTWGKYPFFNVLPTQNTWSNVYSAIMVANTALDGLGKIEANNNNRNDINTAKGCALTIRGYFFWKMATTFSKSYNESTASSDLGIPLRLNVNVNEKSVRASVQQTYDQVIKDLNAALQIVPNKAAYITRASKPAVYAILSEVYLSMRKYEQAKLYADSSLSLKNELIDFNLLDKNSTTPIPFLGSQYDNNNRYYNGNNEILLAMKSDGNPWQVYSEYYSVDSLLYNSYKAGDLRKSYYFTTNGPGMFYFTGTYISGAIGGNFTGPAVDEMYLTRAECLARADNIGAAMGDLNTLMKNRIDKSSFIPYTANSRDEALKIILEERRKELCFRDLRWMDIKRLNLEGANITLKRKISGKTYSLAPNSNRFAIPIPPEVVQLSGVPQNPE